VLVADNPTLALDAVGPSTPTVEDVLGRANAGGLSQVARSAGAVAEDGDRRRRRRPKIIQHVAQLLRLPIGLGRHAGKHDLRAVVVADLSDEDLEGPRLVAAHRCHVPAVDGECDRLCFGRRSGHARRQGLPLKHGADMQGPLANRLYLRGVAEQEEVPEQRAGAAVRQRGAHLGEGALIFRRAAVGHDLRDRGDGPA